MRFINAMETFLIVVFVAQINLDLMICLQSTERRFCGFYVSFLSVLSVLYGRCINESEAFIWKIGFHQVLHSLWEGETCLLECATKLVRGACNSENLPLAMNKLKMSKMLKFEQNVLKILLYEYSKSYQFMQKMLEQLEQKYNYVLNFVYKDFN